MILNILLIRYWVHLPPSRLSVDSKVLEFSCKLVSVGDFCEKKCSTQALYLKLISHPSSSSPDSAGTTNGCSTNNGACPHLCLPKPGGQKTCVCTTGLVPSQDGTTCVQYDSYAVVSTPRLIRGFHINSSDHSEAMVPVAGCT